MGAPRATASHGDTLRLQASPSFPAGPQDARRHHTFSPVHLRKRDQRLTPPPSIKNILIVEDDEVMRGLLDALLSLEGYHLTLVDSGEKGLHTLGADAGFDLVLTDLHMPGLEGEELARALRAAIPDHVLLIGMSGSAGDIDVLAQLDGFLLKPFDGTALREAIETAIQHRALESSPLKPINDLSSATKVAEEIAPLEDGIFRSLMKMIPASQLGTLYEMTIGDVEKRHARMQTFANTGDLASVQTEAHAMKGSCGMVGALELQALAAEIEGGTTLNTFALAEIPAACLRLRRMLDAKLQTV